MLLAMPNVFGMYPLCAHVYLPASEPVLLHVMCPVPCMFPYVPVLCHLYLCCSPNVSSYALRTHNVPFLCPCVPDVDLKWLHSLYPFFLLACLMCKPFLLGVSQSVLVLLYIEWNCVGGGGGLSYLLQTSVCQVLHTLNGHTKCVPCFHTGYINCKRPVARVLGLCYSWICFVW
jgi:hypothetical protein